MLAEAGGGGTTANRLHEGVMLTWTEKLIDAMAGGRTALSEVMLPPTLPCNLPPKGGNVTLTFLLETVGCIVLSKRARNRAAQPTSSSNPQPIPYKS